MYNYNSEPTPTCCDGTPSLNFGGSGSYLFVHAHQILHTETAMEAFILGVWKVSHPAETGCPFLQLSFRDYFSILTVLYFYGNKLYRVRFFVYLIVAERCFSVCFYACERYLFRQLSFRDFVFHLDRSVFFRHLN